MSLKLSGESHQQDELSPVKKSAALSSSSHLGEPSAASFDGIPKPFVARRKDYEIRGTALSPVRNRPLLPKAVKSDARPKPCASRCSVSPPDPSYRCPPRNAVQLS